MKNKFFEYKGIKLHYSQYKGGVKTLLCFHGFGQNSTFFTPLAKKLSEHYTVYAFDLFYHGGSYWKDCEVALTPQFFSELMHAWLCSQNINSISLCGYSMGGKMVLSLLESLEVHIEKVLLIAPDGVKTNFWYSMATYPYWARRLFRYTVTHPVLFMKLVDFLGKINVLDRGIVRFAKSQMNTLNKRKKVYCTWLTYRKVKANLTKVACKINEADINLIIYLGRYDRIITHKRIDPLLRKVKDYEVFTLDKGHNTLIEDVALADTFKF